MMLDDVLQEVAALRREELLREAAADRLAREASRAAAGHEARTWRARVRAAVAAAIVALRCWADRTAQPAPREGRLRPPA
jgi:hypothetical protein